MSMQFSNTTTKGGLIQEIERNVGFNDGDISGNATRLSTFTADINSALDSVLEIIFSAGGTWQFDDSGHSAHPIITTDLNSGQRDYSFVSDGSGNLILEVHKVLVADSTGLFRELTPADQQSQAPVNYLDGLNTTGQPNTYDKTGMSIFLDPIPNYTKEGGLKVLINREASYFTTSDTTKKPGFAGIFHQYLALRPSYFYCVRNKMQELAKAYKEEMVEMEEKIAAFYSKREKDVVKRLSGRINKTK
jgi:hypothetical protein